MSLVGAVMTGVGKVGKALAIGQEGVRNLTLAIGSGEEITGMEKIGRSATSKWFSTCYEPEKPSKLMRTRLGQM